MITEKQAFEKNKQKTPLIRPLSTDFMIIFLLLNCKINATENKRTFEYSIMLCANIVCFSELIYYLKIFKIICYISIEIFNFITAFIFYTNIWGGGGGK